jgi:hypothetical protein
MSWTDRYEREAIRARKLAALYEETMPERAKEYTDAAEVYERLAEEVREKQKEDR